MDTRAHRKYAVPECMKIYLDSLSENVIRKKMGREGILKFGINNKIGVGLQIKRDQIDKEKKVTDYDVNDSW